MDKKLEMMQKLIDEKKKNGMNRNNSPKAQKVIGKSSKGVKIGNGRGLFDK
ncbi:hypothetical protein [Clostridium cellulovorans]|uniref:Uncharacterized protein n=1 Tax=Clostridium cellulovorans (strain ATCC 35296 / DSM 3052 / OCM 3 / 743B) TaxID=573061 RepID=D9SQM4_CLOC7|nr:hypothetical protein [Clostridium cellulovorans]ADL52230.1 hypothetical protein Clocel_2518 [Clostridium cellulovorans 743B]